MERGFSLLELLIVVAIIAVLVAIAIPMMQDAILRAHVSAAATDAHAIHVAFKRYHMDNSVYPDTTGPTAFGLATFQPLVGDDYYDGRVLSRLKNKVCDGYDAPNGMQEFWLEFSLGYDPSVRFLIADSDNSPLGGGAYYDGIFRFDNGTLIPL